MPNHVRKVVSISPNGSPILPNCYAKQQQILVDAGIKLFHSLRVSLGVLEERSISLKSFGPFAAIFILNDIAIKKKIAQTFALE